MNLYLDLIKEYELNNDFKNLVQHNKGNKNLYHNLQHTLDVVKNISILCELQNRPTGVTRLLMIAGIYHDFNHSGGLLPDSDNIVEALNAVDMYCTASDEDKTFIKELIKCTEYPFKQDLVLNEYQMIIRDADLMQCLEKNYLQHVLIGLSIELKNTPYLEIKTIENQISFINGVKIFTKEAQEIFSKRLPELMTDYEYLIKILK